MIAEYKRHKELFAQGLISKSDFDSVEQKMKAAEIVHKTLQAAVAGERGRDRTERPDPEHGAGRRDPGPGAAASGPKRT